MELGFVHILSLITTLAVVLGCGIYSSRKVKSADDFDVGGRSAGVIMVAGSIAATIIGGAATIGTAQGGFTFGFAAWWFTLGSGIGFLIMAAFYARPLRKSGLTTISEYLVINFWPAGRAYCKHCRFARYFFQYCFQLVKFGAFNWRYSAFGLSAFGCRCSAFGNGVCVFRRH